MISALMLVFFYAFRRCYSSTPLLRQKSRCPGLDPAGVSVVSHGLLTGTLAAISLAGLMCDFHAHPCVYMRFAGASSTPLLRQKSRCPGLDPAGVSVVSHGFLTGTLKPFLWQVLFVISAPILVLICVSQVLVRHPCCSKNRVVRALILLVFRWCRMGC